MAKSNRLISLDIFRGLTVAFMIIVNTPGSWSHIYSPLRHSEWDGCTPADMVFPFFLYIVGVSIWYSLKKYGLELNSTSLFRISRRSVAIFGVGLFLAIFPYFNRDYSNLRIMGVLQRISLAYGLGALLCVTVRRDYLWSVAAGLLLMYWGILAIFGGNDPFSLDGNFVLKVDQAILGKDHMYNGFGRPFEPEGLLSTIPAIATVIIGFYSGELTGMKGHNIKTVFKLVFLGLGMTGSGIIWGKLFPINKPLWTSSYVLYTAGFAMLVFAVIYWIADVAKLKKWGSFFNVFGINALFSFFLAGIWTRLLLFIRFGTADGKITLYDWLYENIFAVPAGNMTGSLVFAIFQMMIIWSFAYLLFRNKLIIKL
jgi:predicted acyltransferase